MYVDSHCHLHLIDYSALGIDMDAVVAQAQTAGVEHLLCVATHPEQQEELFNIGQRYKNVSISFGLHPNDAIAVEPTAEDYLAVIASAEQLGVRLVAIGETGLDYFRTTEGLDAQRDRFRTQIQVAKAAVKPLIIHTRAAKEDTVRILREEGARDVGGVIHCFTEDWDYAKQVLDLDFHVSFSGIVTFKQAHELQLVAQQLPLERMLIETDSPYLAPVPLRGKINQPAYVIHVAKYIADLRNISVQEFALSTTSNYHRLFGM